MQCKLILNWREFEEMNILIKICSFVAIVIVLITMLDFVLTYVLKLADILNCD
jgi:hypothetical protein